MNQPEPNLNTWWTRNCNGKRYLLRDIVGTPNFRYVWIYEEGVNRCLHIPLATLRKRYTQILLPNRN